ncbi:MAG TPA: DUF4127 family protein [Candidatus Tyrphobacter sp.]
MTCRPERSERGARAKSRDCLKPLLWAFFCAMLFPGLAFASTRSPIVFVPTDDRPVTLQLPVMLGRIAGRSVVAPPRALLGHFLQAGKPDAIIAWLNSRAPRNASAYVLSTDMLNYGGLLASRVPGPAYLDAYFREKEFARLRARNARAWIAAFGTIMRLAPTGIPAIGPGTTYFAAGPTWQYLWEYAKLHDPLPASEEATAATLRAQAGPAFDQYLADRARDLAVDRLLVKEAVPSGPLDHFVLGQDDAGPVGIDVPDRAALQDDVARAGANAEIEPGTDELGMALVAQALARGIGWQPRIAVRYSTPGGADARDPLEYAPIADAIDALIAQCGGVVADSEPQIVLYVRVPATTPAQDDAFIEAMRADADGGRSVALADLTYLEGGGSPGYAVQGAFAQRILADGLASRLDAYASWNTNANTVGTALAEAVAAGVGRRAGTYDAIAHREFTFMRMIDDYAYHDDVRPLLNAQLDARHLDHMILLPPDDAGVAAENRALLWNAAQTILAQLYPNYHIAAMQITLPWDRTFETQIEVSLAPDLYDSGL